MAFVSRCFSQELKEDPCRFIWQVNEIDWLGATASPKRPLPACPAGESDSFEMRQATPLTTDFTAIAGESRSPATHVRRVATALLLAVAAICCGCAREPDKLERFRPAPDLAERALEAVLSDWKAGKPPGSIDRLAVKVNITDNQRTPGQLLDDFEILGEVPGATARCFAVRLKLREPIAEEKVRYAVFGIDPLWVFRQEDLEMLGHWEHPMPAEEEEVASQAGDQPTSNESEAERANEQSEKPDDQRE
jgi:hypothetical protein